MLPAAKYMFQALNVAQKQADESPVNNFYRPLFMLRKNARVLVYGD